jgi:GNAT superfamily N-acetyltransferase
MTELYSQYIKERENMDMVCVPHGFATYLKIDDDTYYLVNIFVEKGFRARGLASELSEMVRQIAKADGAKRMLGSVDITKNGVTESLSAILANGFRYSHANGNGLYFEKDVGD